MSFHDPDNNAAIALEGYWTNYNLVITVLYGIQCF